MSNQHPAAIWASLCEEIAAIHDCVAPPTGSQASRIRSASPAEDGKSQKCRAYGHNDARWCGITPA
jgi:hypothetical protein